MKLALSNLAWDFDDSDIIFQKLKDTGIQYVELVPTKISDWSTLDDEKIIDYKNKIENYGLTPYSMQSLFYNVKCDDINDTETIISHFKKLIHISKLLNIEVLVFGSPNLRKKIGDWNMSLYTIFKKVDELLMDSNITICIEPNSKIYNGEFFHTISEIVGFIKENQLQNVKTMIDLHNLLLESSNVNNDFINYFEHINHIHISEPKLTSIGNHYSFHYHNMISKLIKESNYDKIITYEIFKNDNILSNIETFYSMYN